LFWEADVQNMDLQEHRLAIIERITTRGHFDEFRVMLNYYGITAVRDTLLDARWLDKRTLAFCSTIFDIPETAFRCYKLAQSNPEHWNY
jgi:hypothetical protein